MRGQQDEAARERLQRDEVRVEQLIRELGSSAQVVAHTPGALLLRVRPAEAGRIARLMGERLSLIDVQRETVPMLTNATNK